MPPWQYGCVTAWGQAAVLFVSRRALPDTRMRRRLDHTRAYKLHVLRHIDVEYGRLAFGRDASRRCAVVLPRRRAAGAGAARRLYGACARRQAACPHSPRGGSAAQSGSIKAHGKACCWPPAAAPPTVQPRTIIVERGACAKFRGNRPQGSTGSSRLAAPPKLSGPCKSGNSDLAALAAPSR